jgi:hypothetical protein
MGTPVHQKYSVYNQGESEVGIPEGTLSEIQGGETISLNGSQSSLLVI